MNWTQDNQNASCDCPAALRFPPSKYNDPPYQPVDTRTRPSRCTQGDIHGLDVGTIAMDIELCV